jgi:translation elongation factor EF-4
LLKVESKEGRERKKVELQVTTKCYREEKSKKRGLRERKKLGRERVKFQAQQVVAERKSQNRKKVVRERESRSREKVKL